MAGEFFPPSPLTTATGITRAAIATYKPAAGINTIVTTGFATTGDLGANGVYTSTGATSGGLMAIQDANGTWWNLVVNGPINVGWLGVTGNGITNDTPAINAGIAYLQSLTSGGELFFPAGTYAVTEINLTNTVAVFNQTIKLRGEGRFMSRIIAFSAGNVLLNLMGTNCAIIQDLSFSSLAYVSQCAIFLSCSTTSVNCNNNKFLNVWIEYGDYSVASVVNNGAESSYWIGGRIENDYSTNTYRCLWAAGGTGAVALLGVTTIHGGTQLDGTTTTDNKWFGVEFYCPYAGCTPVRFSIQTEQVFFGCTIVAGTVNNVKMVTYDIGAGQFFGPIEWHGCHFEVFGTGNIINYLNGGGTTAYFEGISIYGGILQTGSSNTAALFDYDRTNIAEQPILNGGNVVSPIGSAGSSGTKAYVYALFGYNFSFKPNVSDGILIVSGFVQNSNIDVTTFHGAPTRIVGGTLTTSSNGIPTSGQFTLGQVIRNETPAIGQPTGWVCTASGELGTLNSGATTGSLASGSNVLTVNTSTGLEEGNIIAINLDFENHTIRKISGTTIYLNENNSGASVVSQPVGFTAAVLAPLANL